MDSAQMQKPGIIEWPTVFLAFVIYGSWGALTYFHSLFPAWFVIAAGAWVVAWHSSLQHEMVHGHPTPWRRLNTALAFPPLSLWLPYHAYRSSHLDHHRAEILADPDNDPESFYWTRDAWSEFSPIGKTLVLLQTSLIGRLVLGPAWNAGCLIVRELEVVRSNPRDGLVNWGAHLVGCGVVLIWVVGICKIDPWFYLFGIVYPGTSLSLVRSFAEHRAARTAGEETAIVENAKIFGLLFLFNNLHVVHHYRPDLPWYKIPGWYKEHRDSLISWQAARVYQGYSEIARRYLFKSFDDPIHPLSYE
jgi:fatty acid desaturase